MPSGRFRQCRNLYALQSNEEQMRVYNGAKWILFGKKIENLLFLPFFFLIKNVF